MNRLREVSEPGLRWTRPAVFSRLYELRSGEEVVATLEYPGLLTSRAAASIDGVNYLLQRTGFMRKTITVRGTPEGSVFGVLEQGWGGGGSLRLASGAVYEWSKGNFWGTTWRFSQ